jgi:hypothetical protein
MDWQRLIVFVCLAGGGLVYLGVRLNSTIVNFSGIILQIGAGAVYLKFSWYPVRGTIFLNSYYLHCLLLSFSAWNCMFLLRDRGRFMSDSDRCMAVFLMPVALFWWYAGGLREIDMQMYPWNFENGMLLYSATGSIGFGLLAEKLKWESPKIMVFIHLPLIILLGISAFLKLPAGGHLFSGWGWLAWGIALYTQYRILLSYGKKWRRFLLVFYHLCSAGVVMAVICHEINCYLVNQF